MEKDVRCPSCRKSIFFADGESQMECPFCGQWFDDDGNRLNHEAIEPRQDEEFIMALASSTSVFGGEGTGSLQRAEEILEIRNAARALREHQAAEEIAKNEAAERNRIEEEKRREEERLKEDKFSDALGKIAVELSVTKQELCVWLKTKHNATTPPTTPPRDFQKLSPSSSSCTWGVAIFLILLAFGGGMLTRQIMLECKVDRLEDRIRGVWGDEAGDGFRKGVDWGRQNSNW